MEGIKVSRGILQSGNSSRSIPHSDGGSTHDSIDKNNRDGDEVDKEATKEEITKLQEEVASMKGDNLQEFMQAKENTSKERDKTSRSLSTISPKPTRRRPTKNLDLHQAETQEDFYGTNRKSASPMTKSARVHSHPFGRETDGAIDGWSQLTPTSSLHGNTSKVAATHNRRRTWDWNNLPRAGSSILAKHHSFNIISLPIDGEIKQILYSPSYNENFKAMNIFLSFNMDSKSKDAQLQSKKRLNSFGTYIGHYLRSRLYAYQCFPFYQQEPPVDRTYASYDSTKDYSEVETIISLWYMQGQRCISQSNSVFFSAEVVQHLLQRKVNSRNQAVQQTAIYVPQTGATLMSAKPNTTETTEDIDILLLRPHMEPRLGWQLAYDEPNLKVADYPLDTSPWMMEESDAKYILGSQNSKISSSVVNIVNDEKDVVRISNENAGRYFLDCMGRRTGSISEDAGSPVTSAQISASPSFKEDTPLIGSGQGSPPNTNEPSRKKVASKLGKKTGLAHLFKRKHTPVASVPSSPQDKSSQMVSDDQGNSIENAWLESYFSRYLSNYKKIDLPTQFLLPKEAQDTPKVRFPSGNQELPQSKKAFLYSKESLQLKLPFADDLIPAIFCPRIWMNLAFSKWRSLLREMYRVLLPGGYAMAAVTDIGVSNSFTQTTEGNMQEFPTTQERDRVLDAIAVAAIEKGLHIYPTQHLAQAFKDVGFTNLKYSVLSLKTGDCSTEMGCLYEIYSEITWDLLFRKHLPDPTKPPKGTEPTTLFRRFIREHMGKVDDNAGSLRTLYLVAQKPRKSNV